MHTGGTECLQDRKRRLETLILALHLRDTSLQTRHNPDETNNTEMPRGNSINQPQTRIQPRCQITQNTLEQVENTLIAPPNILTR
jgi:hypothetical protein